MNKLIDAHRKLRIKPEALYLTVHLVDDYLARVPDAWNSLSLLGVTSLLISAKYCENYPPTLDEILSKF